MLLLVSTQLPGVVDSVAASGRIRGEQHVDFLGDWFPWLPSMLES